MNTRQIDIFNYSRRATVEVAVGNVLIGSAQPVRVQSMTNTGTMDTEGSVEQTLRIVERGGELVRLTTQGNREAVNLGNIKQQLLARGCQVPLVADVHFNAGVADTAARYADKVRVNPGNYVDTARTFKHIDYTDAEYADELKRLRKRFVAFLDICKDLRVVRFLTLFFKLTGSALCSLFRCCGKEYLKLCIGKNNGSYVSAVHNNVIFVRNASLHIK